MFALLPHSTRWPNRHRYDIVYCHSDISSLFNFFLFSSFFIALNIRHQQLLQFRISTYTHTNPIIIFAISSFNQPVPLTQHSPLTHPTRTHSRTHSLTHYHSLTHPFTHSLTHSLPVCTYPSQRLLVSLGPIGLIRYFTFCLALTIVT